MATEPDVDGLDAAGAQAIRRWKLGHHLFHLLLVAMTTSLDAAVQAGRARAWRQLSRLMDRLADLYDAATASMKYAAAFEPRLYESLIRPSMAPPHMSPGFSGLLNRDHARMLERMGDLRAVVDLLVRQDAVPAHVAQAAQRLWAAQARNRRHHVLVCERFVPGGRSLLKDHFEQRRAHQPALVVTE